MRLTAGAVTELQSNLLYTTSTPTTPTIGGVPSGSTFTNAYVTAMLDQILHGPNNTVNNAMLAQMPAQTIKGNNTGATANALDMTPAQLAAIMPVTPNSGLAQMPATTIKGNSTGSTASPQDMTPLQVAQMLPAFSTTASGVVPASTTSSYTHTFRGLRDNATWIPVFGQLLASSYTASAESTNSTTYVNLATPDGFNFYVDYAGATVFLWFFANIYNDTASAYQYTEIYDGTAASPVVEFYNLSVQAAQWQTCAFCVPMTCSAAAGSLQNYQILKRVNTGNGFWGKRLTMVTLRS